MRLPSLTPLKLNRDYVNVMRGYNHNPVISDGEWYEMTNMCSDGYPTIQTRKGRGTGSSNEHPYALTTVGGEIAQLVGVVTSSGGDISLTLHMKWGSGTGAHDITLGTRAFVPIQDHYIVPMGAYRIIMPEGIWFNTVDYSYGEINASNSFEYNGTSTSTDGLLIVPVDEDGVELYPVGETVPAGAKTFVIHTTAPSDPEDGDLWACNTEYDAGKIGMVINIWLSSSSSWTPIKTNLKLKFLTASNISWGVEAGDPVEYSGSVTDWHSTHAVGGSLDLARLKGIHKIVETGSDYIIIENPYALFGYSAKYSFTFSRTMPDMDFVIESGNRLWGCKYGKADGKMLNEIYATELGSFTRWSVAGNEGISTDAYAASIGTDGPFTGAITYQGHPIFFKENVMHVVYGSMPSNYQINKTECHGVEEGSSKSLAVVGNTLCYKGIDGIYAFDGSMPQMVSYALGGVKYKNGVAGSKDSKYYISMKDKNNLSHLFVCDTRYGMWHREDNSHITGWQEAGDTLYYIEKPTDAWTTIDTALKYIGGDEGSFGWYLVSGDLGLETPDKKYISRITLRMRLKQGSVARFYSCYDGGEWKHITTVTARNLKTFSIPIKIRRCDHYRLKIEGEGEAQIYSISKTTEGGSDL